MGSMYGGNGGNAYQRDDVVVVSGMRKEQVVAAWGEPVGKGGGGRIMQRHWLYCEPGLTVWFTSEGLVDLIQTGKAGTNRICSRTSD